MNNESKKSFKEKFVVDSGHIFIFTILVNLFLSINSMIIARILGPEILGIFSILQFLGGIITVFASFVLYSASTKFIAEYRVIDKMVIGRIIGNIFLLLLISSICMLFVTFVFSDFLSRFYNEPSIGFLLNMYLGVIFFTVFSSFGISTLAGFQKMKLISKLNMV
ncbi:MAG: oligosaccharide flippase family protein, partial [Candidatus Altarchaeum sp.]|nr:oligosaccharide flippase family protein [Candidatus Altarchaeum sp.]